jgi:nucleotide-binding universal stress UspA family protein
MPTPVINRILFPIDFSASSYSVAPCVKAVADQYQARVTLMSVMAQARKAGDTNAPADVPARDQEPSKRLQTRLDEAVDQDFAQLSTETVADSGDPIDVINRFVHFHGVDLVMMPTYGHGPFRSSSLGSVTAGVLDGAQCPVWTATHVEVQPGRQHLRYRVVVCAVDGTPKSTPVIEWAARFASDWGATLRLVHVIPSGMQWSGQPYSASSAVSRKEASEAIDRLQRSVGVRSPVSISVGEIQEEVREEAQRQEADSLVIGRGLSDETRGRLGSHSRGIIQRAPCPVVSL